jgi:hypothetical protein
MNKKPNEPARKARTPKEESRAPQKIKPKIIRRIHLEKMLRNPFLFNRMPMPLP